MMRTVVIDANTVVRGSWYLDSAPWRLLRYRGRAQLDRLVVPEIVVREVVGSFRAELAASSDRAKALGAEFRRLRVSSTPAPEFDIDAEVDIYERHLRQLLADARVDLSAPPVGILDLADRAIARRRPFNEKGAGFRDAALWEHVIAEAGQRRFGRLAFISNDGDFGTSDGLHPDLARDLRTRADDRPVDWFRTVDDYVRASGASDAHLAAEIAELIEDEAEQVATSVLAAANGVRWRSLFPDAEVLLEVAHRPVTVWLVGVTVTEGAPQALVELDVEFDADLYVEPWDRDEYGSDVSGSATLSSTASIAFDLESRQLDDLVLSEPTFGLDDWLRSHRR